MKLLRLSNSVVPSGDALRPSRHRHSAIYDRDNAEAPVVARII
jgi:hypothetical protein